MDGIEKRFLASLSYLSPEDRAGVETALARVTEWHAAQKRESGEPFVIHLIATAYCLARLECGATMLIAGLLHDAVEDGVATLQTIESLFGAEVAKLVDAVTKLTKLRYEGRRSERQIASLRKMLLAASEDLRVIFIKLADRLHNVETLEALRPDKQERIARETLEIYVPFARLVGLLWMKRCFEECCFPLAFPREAEEWGALIEARRKELEPEREKYFRTLKEAIRMPVVVELTKMTDYELFMRCDRNPQLLRDSSVIDSVLVLPEDPHAEAGICYRILGDIHEHFTVKSASFRDFISQPLPSGYRGLRTTVFLSPNHLVRTRIQTKEMYAYAFERKYSAWMSDKKNELYKALGSLHQQYYDHDQYLSELKSCVLKEKISIFTPAGDIMSLPRGATGIDVAFTLNPDALSNLAAVRVNGEVREATAILRDGDTVELVLTRERQEGGGNYEALWGQRAGTGGAREALREAAARKPEDQLLQDGRAILEHECRKHRLPLRWLFRFAPMQREVAAACGAKNFEELLGKVGAGFIASSTVVEAYTRALRHPSSIALKILRILRLIVQSRKTGKEISGMEIEVRMEDRPGMLHTITRCFAERDINIVNISTKALQGSEVLDRIRLNADSFEQFSDLYDTLLQVPGVKSVVRTR